MNGEGVTREVTRQLAAIMFTDIVGFTELMQNDEAAGLALRDRHKSVFEEQHRVFGGEIRQYWGDGTLSTFHDPGDAVRCAEAIQKELRIAPEVPLRIGIHTGTIVIEADGIMGDAVNIASRIESFSVPGGIMISDSLYEQVRNQPGFDFVSLGKFILKNVSRPFELFAVAAEGLTVPSSDSLQGKGLRTGSLGLHFPEAATPLLGRGKQLEEITELIQQFKVVTITGAGGMGKTRFVTEICHRLAADYNGGVLFVSMESILAADDLIPELADKMGIKEAEGRTPADAIANHIYDKKVLLVLDNLEQIVDAAGDIAALSAKCPNLRILVTSRTPLRIRAEQVFPLQPLPLPEDGMQEQPETLLSYPAIALFLDRAGKVKPGFTLTAENGPDVAEICRRVDGLPLAIELAAARIRIMAPKALLQRLTHALDMLTTGERDQPERHRTIRAAIDWSHDLLTGAEKQLFRRISVFVGTFTLEGIESICYDDSAWQAPDELESLVDKGLVHPTENGDRFRMLQTIKEYAIEKQSVADDKNSIDQRHALYYQQFARKLGRGIESVDQIEWIRRAPAEEAGMQAALDYLLVKASAGDQASAESGLAMCGDMFLYWHMRGKHVSGLENTRAFLEVPSCPESSPGKCSALLTAALCSWTMGHYGQSMEESQAAYEMAKIFPAGPEMVLSGTMLAVCNFGIATGLAIELSEEAGVLAEKLDHQYLLGQAKVFNGLAHLISGHFDVARDRFEEVLMITRRTKDNEARGLAFSSLAILASGKAEYSEAMQLYRESLACFESVEDFAEEARVYSEMGWTCLAMKDSGVAREHFFSSIHLYEKVGSIRGIGLALIGIAAVETVGQNYRTAVQIAAAAELFSEQGGIVNIYADDFPGALYIDHARAELTPEELEQWVQKGRKLTVKQALQLGKGVVEPEFAS